MARRLSLASLALLLLPTAQALGHGGSYRGPGDVTPRNPPRPGDARESGTGPGAGSTGWRTSEPPPTTTPEDAAASLRSTWLLAGGPVGRADLLRWQAWWGFHRDGFLDLKARLHTADVLVGSDEAFLVRRAWSFDELRPSPDVVFREVAPALLELLERETSNEILSGALIALAKIGDAPGRSVVAGSLAPFLADPNQELAETAAVALGILGSQAQVELLGAALSGNLAELRRQGIELASPPSERTRAFAAYGLGLVGARCDGPVRERIAALLGNWMRQERALAAQDEIPVACVVALGLVPLPTDPFTVGPWHVVPLPERMCTFEEQVQWMLALLESREESPRVRAHVPTALARLLCTPQGSRCLLRRLALERLSTRLEASFDEHPDVRTGCIIALGQLATAGSEDAALRARLMRVRDEFHDPVLACFASISLGRASSRAGLGAEPFGALAEGPAGSRAYLLEQLCVASSVQRCYAALALGLLERGADEVGQGRSEGALAALRGALAEAGSPDEIGAYSIALGIARDRSASALLRQRLGSVSDAEARGHIAVALGLVGDRGSTARLRGIVAASRFQPELLRQAALALGLLGDKDVVPQLFDMLSRATSLSSQAAIASALGLIGDARSLDGLIAMTRERGQRTDLARAFAAVALGMCADKERLPWNEKLATGANYRASTSTLYSPDTGTGVLDIL